jgi:heme exporter protein A
VRAVGIVKEFGFRRVLDGVSLEVAAGTSLSLLGPNGAGKTTLLRILATLARPTSGRVEIQGLDVRGRHQIAIRARIGVISHQTFLYDGLTAWENLLFFAGQYGVHDARERAETLLREFGLWERRDDRTGTFSRGMQQRLTIARALLHDPEILFLDEPFTGLDPAASRLLRALFERLRGSGRTLVMTTHDVDEGLALGDRWAILADGVLADGGSCRELTPAALEERYFALLKKARIGAPAGASA